MYDLSKIEDYDRFLREVFFPANPEPCVNADGAYLDPKFDGDKYIGKNFTPEESIERLKVGFGRSWPNGTDQPAVIDPISMYGHYWINYQRGYDPQGKPIKDSLQGQPTSLTDQPITIQGAPQTVLVVPAARLDAIEKNIKTLLVLQQ